MYLSMQCLESFECFILLYLVCFDYDIRLVGGSIGGEGRIELCYNNEWGTVCDDDWDVIEARIVCKQFGFSGISFILFAGP